MESYREGIIAKDRWNYRLMQVGRSVEGMNVVHRHSSPAEKHLSDSDDARFESECLSMFNEMFVISFPDTPGPS